MDTHNSNSKQIHIWIDRPLYDQIKELVSNGMYGSMSELVRDGLNTVIDKASGYEDMRRQEIASRFGPNDMTETRIRIDGALMRMRVNARWWHMNAKDKLTPLIADLEIPQPLSNIEEKYGTKIELYNMHQKAPDEFSDDGYKETYAYKLEHGLPIDED